jgi:hypothetical protein
MKLRTILFFAVAGRLFGQLASDTLTISASRVLSIQADQTDFNVTVDAPPSNGLDEILTAIQTSAITAANLSSLRSLTDGTLEWFFTLPVSFAKVQTTAAALVTLQQTIAKSNNGLTLSFYIGGLQASDALAQAQSCPVTDLLSDAQSQAKKLADAAGFVVGPILTINGSSANSAAALADFFSVPTGAKFVNAVNYPAPAPPACAITVKFRLLRYQ